MEALQIKNLGIQEDLKSWTKIIKDNLLQLQNERYRQKFVQDNLDKRDQQADWTILHGFAASMDPKIMKSLLRNLPNIELLLEKDKDGDIPLQSAIRTKDSKRNTQLFLEKQNAHKMLCSRNKKKQTPLCTAFYLRRRYTEEILLDRYIKNRLLPKRTGVYPNDYTGTRISNTYLHKAFKRGDVAYLDIFLRVCKNNQIEDDELIKALLIPNKKNETPWYHAIHYLTVQELKKVLESLKRENIDISSLYTDPDMESTMLHEAYRHQYKEYCELLEDGKVIQKQDKEGRLPSDRNRHIDVIEFQTGQSDEAEVAFASEDDLPQKTSHSSRTSTSYSTTSNTEAGNVEPLQLSPGMFKSEAEDKFLLPASQSPNTSAAAPNTEADDTEPPQLMQSSKTSVAAPNSIDTEPLQSISSPGISTSPPSFNSEAKDKFVFPLSANPSPRASVAASYIEVFDTKLLQLTCNYPVESSPASFTHCYINETSTIPYLESD